MITDRYVQESLNKLSQWGPPSEKMEPFILTVSRSIQQGKYRRILLPIKTLKEVKEEPLTVDYVAILCYYVLTNECLLQLPRAYEAVRYFKSVQSTQRNQLLYSLQTAPERLWRSLPGLPKCLIKSDLHSRLSQCEDFANHYTESLGRLMVEFRSGDQLSLKEGLQHKLNALSQFLQLRSTNILEILQSTTKVTEGIGGATAVVTGNVPAVKPPSFATRYWPAAVIALCYGPTSLMAIWQSRETIKQFLQENVIDFIRGLIINWVYTPLRQVWATVRHDDDSSIAVMSQGTLSSESSSLTRMIVHFMQENTSQPLNEEQLVSQVEKGDLTQFLKIYETQLEHPVRNIASGALIRSLLIQIQKTKVDGSLALNGIDRMLQSQQLVFGVVALSPALLIIYTLTTSAYRLCKIGRLWSYQSQHKEILNKSLSNAERLLNYDEVEAEESYWNQGLLAIEVTTVHQMGLTLLPLNTWEEWTRDVAELTDPKLSLNSRLHVVYRIYHTYSKYF
ncbi:hypothetical protein ZYGR_0AK04170 [Zygosaccharomyces rouxii]|uniref:Nuclear control of ATPase protein 2 n=1 Tax=Zygosaccharomyces rouxii TaxID=4956 RepID=A0A1Q3AE62_ZYGRO|nr:hypothetical protein ZYGR_0AK04170 [Zygosaccharomyces rouxii]